MKRRGMTTINFYFLRRASLPFIVALVTCFAPDFVFATASIADAVGAVQIRKAGSQSWGSVTGAGHVIDGGDEIKTGRASRVVLQFEDGSKVEIGANGSFQLEEAKKEGASMKFNLGFMKAWVSKAMSRRFQVRTPTAVCSVRGTEFGVNVADGGNTNVSVFTGLVGVGDSKGNEVLLAEGQSVNVTLDGITQKSQGPTEQGADRTRQALKREVGLDMTKEEVKAAAAIEIKQAVYQEGKALIDVHGNRVRVEQYIIRPAANQFKLVALNERSDRFDYFFFHGTMNKNLPDDMSLALRQLQGQAINKPEFFLASYKTGRSSVIDNVMEDASGGHLVDVNNNPFSDVDGDLIDDDNVTSAFDPQVDGVVNLLPGQPYWTTLYDRYEMTFNGNPHDKWVNAVAAYNPLTDTGGVQSYYLPGQITTTDYGLVLRKGNDCLDAERCTGNPQPGVESFVSYRSNATGAVWDRFEFDVINDEGKLAAVGALPGGAARKSALMLWNFEQVITASEFNGRKIDIVITPRTLIQAGIIK